MSTQSRYHFDWLTAIKLGLLGGAAASYLCVVGLVESFGEATIVDDVIAFGHGMLFFTILGSGFFGAQRALDAIPKRLRVVQVLSSGGLAGLLSGVLVAILVLIADNIRLRAVFVNLSPELLELLIFEQSTGTGILLLIVGGAVVGIMGAAIRLLHIWELRTLLLSMATVTVVGLLSDVLRAFLVSHRALTFLADFFLAPEGMTKGGAVVLFALVGGLASIWLHQGQAVRDRIQILTAQQRQVLNWTSIATAGALLIFLPWILGSFLSEAVGKVGLFVLLGIGLNIVVGYCGMLDLGYVAYFAIGAYTLGVLTTTSAMYGGAELSFWAALPIASGAAMLAGIILAVPALKKRGAYLAIVTLSFAEIIDRLAESNWLKPFIGGAQGINGIPRPTILGQEFDTFQLLYYLILAACGIAIFIAWRLRDAQLGQAWMAIGEDRNADADMGISLVRTKLLAVAIGAALAGAGGAIFASQASAIDPSSFRSIVSINVLSLIVLGGMGSLPGVVVGSLLLVGLPEVLSALNEHKVLLWSAVLVVMMLVRPKGLWPETMRRREFHTGEGQEARKMVDVE